MPTVVSAPTDSRSVGRHISSGPSCGLNTLLLAKTYLKDEMGDELLNHTATLAEVRSKAVVFETRERNRAL